MGSIQSVVAGVLVLPVTKPIIEIIHLVVGGTEGVVTQVGNITARTAPEAAKSAVPVLVEADRALRSVPTDSRKLPLPHLGDGGTAFGLPCGHVHVLGALYGIGVGEVLIHVPILPGGPAIHVGLRRR